jgi:hypothetical protein
LHWVAVAVRIPDDWCNKWLLRLSNNKHNNMHCFYSMYYGLQCENAHCFGGIVKKEWCIGVDSSVEMSMKDWQKCLDRTRSLYHKTVQIDPSTHRPIVTSNPWQMKKGPPPPRRQLSVNCWDDAFNGHDSDRVQVLSKWSKTHRGTVIL